MSLGGRKDRGGEGVAGGRGESFSEDSGCGGAGQSEVSENQPCRGAVSVEFVGIEPLNRLCLPGIPHGPFVAIESMAAGRQFQIL
jgi:hypothetical protein